MGFLHQLGVAAIVGGHAPNPLEAMAIVQVGLCSGVLVRPNVVLTSGHCLDGSTDRVVIAEKSVRVTECVRHPAYEAGVRLHDIGLCRLEDPSNGAVIPIDDGPDLVRDQRVALAGFGLPGTSARRVPPLLRVVDTSVLLVSADHVVAGTDTETACRGDSGGPLLVDRGNGLRVAGLIRGGAGATCLSPSEVVPTSTQWNWLEHELSLPRFPSQGPANTVLRTTAILGGLIAAFVVLIAGLLMGSRSRFRRSRK